MDVRRSSPTFGEWQGLELSAENGKQLLIPPGYAHGFLTLEQDCAVAYKVDAPYAAASEGGIAWDDPAIAIDWPLTGAVLLSDRDRTLPLLDQLEIDFAYNGQPLGPLPETVL